MTDYTALRTHGDIAELTVLAGLWGHHGQRLLVELTPDQFGNPAHATIWRGALAVHTDHGVVLMTRVQQWCDTHTPDGIVIDRDAWDAIGFPIDEWHILADAAATITDLDDRRTLAREAARLTARIADMTVPASDIRLDHVGRLTGGDQSSGALEVLTMEELCDMPELPPLVDGILPQGQTTLYGPEKSGKSWIAVSLATAVAEGTSWFGHDIAHPGPVLYLIGEGKGAIAKRIKAWRSTVGGRAAPVDFICRTMSLSDPREQARLRLEVQQRRPVMLVVDTWQRFAGLTNENDIAEQARPWALLDQLRDDLDVSSLVVHHTNADGGIRGRGLPGTNADLTIRVTMDDDTGHIGIAPRLVRDGSGFAPMSFRFVPSGVPTTPFIDLVADGRYTRGQRMSADALAAIRDAGVMSLEALADQYGQRSVDMAHGHPEVTVAGDRVYFGEGPL